MTFKIYDQSKSELMAVSALERDGNELVIRGKIYGAMPMSARLRPEDARKVFGLLNFKTRPMRLLKVGMNNLG